MHRMKERRQDSNDADLVGDRSTEVSFRSKEVDERRSVAVVFVALGGEWFGETGKTA